jgi:hypothetical protein
MQPMDWFDTLLHGMPWLLLIAVIAARLIKNPRQKTKRRKMMSSILTNLSTGWTFMRWLRLGLGLFVAYQAVMHHDALAGLVSETI